jgi:hypothetical protein
VHTSYVPIGAPSESADWESSLLNSPPASAQKVAKTGLSPSAHSPLSRAHSPHAVPSEKRHTPYYPEDHIASPSLNKVSLVPPLSAHPTLAGLGMPIRGVESGVGGGDETPVLV